MTEPCIYLTAPVEMHETRRFGDGWRRVENPERFLCAWATYAPEAVEKMTDVPPWLVRNAGAGHLVRPETDCPLCPYNQPGDPVE